ncbi:SDR family oxidoreductase [Streptomyces luteireticuli]|uniref:SDR family oxidoreductase n=1 Tax=Streptomyces luteireticuli TaxID=173858 RepID=UPI00355810CA
MSDRQLPGRAAVAVVGLGALLPDARDVGQSWRLILGRRNLMQDIPPTRWLVDDHYHPVPGTPGKVYTRRGAFLPAVDFDPLSYGIPPQSLASTDTAQLLALTVADQVLRDAADGGSALPDRDRVAVVLGAAGLSLLTETYASTQRPVWFKALREHGLPEAEAQAVCERILAHYPDPTEDTFPGLLTNVVVGRIAGRFDFHGTNHTTDAACAGSLAALSTALDELALNRADLVISGGVDVTNDIGMFRCFTTTPVLSPTQECRPFAEDADGTMLGEAVVMFALKRLVDAERDGDGVYAVIRGMGSSSDGRGAAIYAPRPQGQALALRRAYREAGYAPDTVELVEAHGTGTKAGDQAEFTALRDVFEESGRAGRQWCALGSVKSQIGHTKTAAGAVGLLKAVLALHHKVLPPTINAERPHPALHMEASPFYLSTRTRPWVRPGATPRRASVSSFGFGGSNFHVTLEEHRPTASAPAGSRPRLRAAPTELLLLCADSTGELRERVAELRRSGEGSDARQRPGAVLAGLACRSQQDFRPGATQRLGVLAADTDQLVERLDLATAALDAGRSPSLPSGLHWGTGTPEPGRLAWLFPGQGSQYVGMGGDLACHHPGALAIWDTVGGTGHGDVALHRVVFPPPVPEDARDAQTRLLAATEWAQPALAAHSLSLLCLLEELGLRPDCVAGHSLGELIALHAAGAYDADTLMRLSLARGKAMRDAAAVTPGAMLVVRADCRETCEALAAAGTTDVWIANDNGPGQTVVSGTPAAIAATTERMRAAGIATLPLAAPAAFHSPLVEAARLPFAAALADAVISPPGPEVLSHADATPYPADADRIRARLARHLTEPVRFADQIEAMYRAGARTFVEAGPGTVLTSLVDRILGERPHLAVPLDRRGVHGVTAFQDALARLAVGGIPLDFAPYWRHFAVPSPADGQQRPRMTVPIDGGNHGRRYPPRTALPEEADGGRATAVPLPAPGGSTELAPAEPPSPRAPAAPAPSAPPSAMADPLPGAPPPVSFEMPIAPPLPGVPPVAASPGPPPEEDDGRTALIEDAQRRTADAHAVFLRSMSEAHTAFLKMSEMSFAALLGSPGAPAPEPYGAPVMPVDTFPAAGPDTPTAPATPALAPVPAAVVVGPPAPEPDATRLEETLLAVVAERTGYPADMLDLDMELEAELGIDSIKRVEILSVLRQRAGELPDIQGDPMELASLRTLRQVVERLRGAVEASGTTVPLPGPAPGPAPGPVVVPELPPGSDQGQPALGRFVTRTVPAPPGGLAMPGLREHILQVVDGGSGLAGLVVECLGERGVRAEAVVEPSPESRAVLLLGGLAENPTAEAALEVQRAAFRTARLLAPRFADQGGVFVTAQDTGGDFGVRGTHGERAWLGGLTALVRTLAAEWPAAAVKAVDCARSGRSPQAVAAAVAGELLCGGALLEAGLPADGSRVTTLAVPASPPGTTSVGPGPDDILVATGGARGVTAAALTALARTGRPHLALLGRTELDEEPAGLPPDADEAALVRALSGRTEEPPLALARRARHILAVREIRATLAAIERAGAPVRYFRADTRDRAAVRSALEAVRAEWGPATGLVHGAGVLADKRIADKTDEDFDQVFGTKVTGLRVLLEATAADPVRTICLFSSVAGRFGNPGQSDYAMANETLAHAAAVEAVARAGCRVRSLDWGPWRGGMVTPSLAGHFESAGVPLLPADTGARAFVDELGAADGHHRVLLLAVPPEEGRPGPLPPTGLRHPRPAGVHVSGETHPQLADHVIGGRAVLPLAQVLEWFLAAVRDWAPGAAAVTLRDVRVLRPAVWNASDSSGTDFTVTGRAQGTDPGELSVELRHADGTLHCTGRAGAGDAPPDPAPLGAPETADGLPPWGRADLYDGEVLSYGPLMRAVTAMEAAGPDGARGTLSGVTALGWTGDIWHSDPAVLDGGLQIGVIWAREALGHAVLPMAVGTFRAHHRGPAPGPVKCAVLPVRAEGAYARCHVRLTGQDGTPFADLLDVELIRRPDPAAADEGGEA